MYVCVHVYMRSHVSAYTHAHTHIFPAKCQALFQAFDIRWGTKEMEFLPLEWLII